LQKGSEKSELEENEEAATTPMWPNWFRSWEWEWIIPVAVFVAVIGWRRHPQNEPVANNKWVVIRGHGHGHHTPPSSVWMEHHPCSKCSRKSMTLERTEAEPNQAVNAKTGQTFNNTPLQGVAWINL